MNDSGTQYDKQFAGRFYLAGDGTALDSIVRCYLEGWSSEEIARSFPKLRVEDVRGAIEYYVNHRSAIDAQVKRRDKQVLIVYGLIFVGFLLLVVLVGMQE